MSKIIDKINAYSRQVSVTNSSTDSSSTPCPPYFSFEFFPPKTEAGVENLYLRMDRMTSLQPIFVDITWSSTGSSSKDLTMTISEYSQTYFGVDVLMHLTCTKMTIDEIKCILIAAKESGIRNILALRGDPPKGAVSWESVTGGLDNATDLVKLIRKEHGDYFCIAVAGFPEGHPQRVHNKNSIEDELHYLKYKIDAGADFILTQFFYDPDVFINYISMCRSKGINCPIVPGMMPIQSFSSFQKMTSFCRVSVPSRIWRELEPIKEDDEAVKAYGVKLCVQMCKYLNERGVPGFHFYTLNLEKSVLSVLHSLGIEDSIATRRALPWRGSRKRREVIDGNGSSSHSNNGSNRRNGNSSSSGNSIIASSINSGSSSNLLLKRGDEDVRPINWANRPKSYIKRTVTWDEFPNGRWGDGRSPAFGELSETHFYRPVGGSKEDRLAMWGEAPITHEEIYEIFALYVEGKIPIIPWCETPLSSETKIITSPLSNINRKGFLTINSQPAINGEKSDNPDYGWGGSGGRVYQKAYIEFFTSESNLQLLIQAINKSYSNINYYAVDYSGKHTYFSADKGVTALTWGVFPNKEILQPTIFDPDTFLVWSEEAFQLWTAAWASLYDDETDSCELLYNIHDTYYLVAIIDNDYVSNGMYRLFDDVTIALSAAEIDSNTCGSAVAVDDGLVV